LELNVMREVLTQHGIAVWEKTPFCPAFIEAGRFTIEGVHYMKDGDRLVPVSETEFAHDNVFAYHTSVLKDYIREKGANPEDYEIVDAKSYDELQTYVDRLMEETADFDGAIVIRSSSSLPKALSGIDDQPLLDRSMLSPRNHDDSPLTPGCFVVGSHVKKTTQQLDCLLQAEGTCGLEIDVQRILDDERNLMEETIKTIQEIVEMQLTPVIYTSRQEIRLDDANQRQHLGQKVSDFLVAIVRLLPFTPSYLVGKGGITSNDILTKGLAMKTARVMGQVVNSVPCVMAREFPYIIFPGNVGSEQSLREVYEKLKS
jgi:uncharacterized protein YgbK (DUF1537 family)